jgi:hypothetical protein
MRLAALDHGHRLPQKLMLLLIRVMMGRVPDVLRTLLYRPEFFGKSYGKLMQAIMRESPHWKPAEAELMAAFVSRRNQCPF